ncbi:MAG: hypothetical protein IPM13_18365 [Phycisphaerales bacterium]|nr:hypothetical protein [Phycisphaerales bacterium]
MRNLLLVPLSLAILSLTTTGCVIHLGDWGAKEWVQEAEAFEVDRAALTSVSCTTHNGDVAIVGSEDAAKIRVYVERRAGGSSVSEAREAMRNIEILHKRVDGGLGLGWRWREKPSRGWRAVVAFRVEQPRDLPAKAVTHNGEITCTDLHAGVTVRSHNGDVAVQGARGALDAVSYNGNVRATAATSRVSVVSHNGSVRVALEGDGPVDGKIESYNGSVVVALPAEPSTALVCSSYNGRVRSTRSLPNAAAGRSSLSAVLGKGEGRLAVLTHNGSVRIE